MTQTLPTEKMTVEQMRGIAQKHGYKNRREFRENNLGPKHRGENIRAHLLHYVGRITFVPFFKPKRKKLKYWQKAN